MIRIIYDLSEDIRKIAGICKKFREMNLNE
jgi:hypothetical protein